MQIWKRCPSSQCMELNGRVYSLANSMGWVSALGLFHPPSAGFPDSSVGKESAGNARDPGLIPGSERSSGGGIGYPLGFPGSSADKESTCNARDPGLIPGSERSTGEGKGYPLQHSGLENSMYCILHGVTKSRTPLSGFHFH